MTNISNVHTATDKTALLRRARIELGRAVLRPGDRVAQVLHDNRRGEWLRLDDAAASGTAYMGIVDHDVLALDSDPSENTRAAAGLAAVTKTLENYGITPVVLASGRPNHRHLFARVQDQALWAEIAQLASDYGYVVRSKNHMIRLPLAPHRSGFEVSLLSPPSVHEAVVALRRRIPRPLGRAMQRELEEAGSRYLSPSERQQGIALAMYQKDWTPSKAYAVLRRSPGGRSLLRYEDDGRDSWAMFLESWRRAVAYARQRPAIAGPKELVSHLVSLRACAEAHPWKGVVGTTQRMVLLRVIDIAIRTSQVEVSASQRQLVEGTSRATRKPIGKALEALESDGWFHRTSIGSGTTASTYRLNLQHRDKTTPVTTSLYGGGVRLTGVFLTHDLFARGGGLGAPAAWVYEAMSTTPLTSTELSDDTNVPLRTVQRALRALAHRDLAEQTATGAWVRGAADIDEVARRRGSAGAGDDLKARHRQERSAYKRYEYSVTGSMVFIMRDVAQRRLCTATTKTGRPCRAWAARDHDECVRHIGPLMPAPEHEPWSREDREWVQQLEDHISLEYELQVLHA